MTTMLANAATLSSAHLLRVLRQVAPDLCQAGIGLRAPVN
jgi:hypothetical protein